ncbi:hypothetical protein ONZ45_g17341 [Pleurotus djamor]|nr:hypothetical protein ONZ45_g17341 [Pleurotus djamor]
MTPNSSTVLTIPGARSSFTAMLDDKSKSRIDAADPNGGRCLITNKPHHQAVQYCHLIGRHTSGKDDRMDSLEFWWHMKHKSLNLDTRYNVFKAVSDLHFLHDQGEWGFLPSESIVGGFYAKITRSSFPDKPENSITRQINPANPLTLHCPCSHCDYALPISSHPTRELRLCLPQIPSKFPIRQLPTLFPPTSNLENDRLGHVCDSTNPPCDPETRPFDHHHPAFRPFTPRIRPLLTLPHMSSHSPIHSHLQPLPSAPIKTSLAISLLCPSKELNVAVSFPRTQASSSQSGGYAVNGLDLREIAKKKMEKDYIHFRTCPRASIYQIPSPTTTTNPKPPKLGSPLLSPSPHPYDTLFSNKTPFNMRIIDSQMMLEPPKPIKRRSRAKK